MKVGVQTANFYFMYPFFGYFQTTNQVHFGYFLRKYKITLGGLLKPLKSTSAGYKWNYTKNESLYYFQQEFQPIFEKRIRTIFQYTD
jgi:hypothetical protein